MGTIKVGTCGYGYYRPPSGWKQQYDSKLQSYSAAFRMGELNSTFYKLPMLKTARRWREETFPEFEFTLKAWQAITHPVTSPTWRKHLSRLTESQKERYGNFNPEPAVLEAWRRTQEVAEALQARICVFQTPPSFNISKDNETNLRRFFRQIDRGNLDLAWEPRGDWKDHPDRVKTICDELGLIHIVDIMRYKPVSGHPVSYLRLHGLNEYEYDYKYDYSEKELQTLANRLRNLSGTHQKIYCLFNNFQMFENAQRLMEILAATSSG